MGIETKLPDVTLSFEDFQYLSKAQRFWDEHSKWSQATFGPDSERGPVGPLKHLEKEAGEAIHEANLKSLAIEGTIAETIHNANLKEELADCFFLVLDSARRAGMSFDDLLNEAFRKLEKNKKRVWQKPTSDDQPIEHVREE